MIVNALGSHTSAMLTGLNKRAFIRSCICNVNCSACFLRSHHLVILSSSYRFGQCCPKTSHYISHGDVLRQGINDPSFPVFGPRPWAFPFLFSIWRFLGYHLSWNRSYLFTDYLRMWYYLIISTWLRSIFESEGVNDFIGRPIFEVNDIIALLLEFNFFI